MGLHGQTSFISFCLLRIPIPVVHRFLFDTDPLWHCLSIFSSVSPGLLHLILMLPMLLLVICSYLPALHARTIVVCISVSFVSEWGITSSSAMAERPCDCAVLCLCPKSWLCSCRLCYTSGPPCTERVCLCCDSRGRRFSKGWVTISEYLTGKGH